MKAALMHAVLFYRQALLTPWQMSQVVTMLNKGMRAWDVACITSRWVAENSNRAQLV